MNHYVNRTVWMLLVVALFSAILPTTAQDSGCPVDVQLALAQSEEICINIGPDQVCYGNRLVTVEPQAQVKSFLFDNPGDMESVASIRSLYLSEMNPATNAWGIAYMRLLVNSSALKPSDVYLVLFGDVAINNLAEHRETLPTTVTASVYINVRQYPFANAGAMAVLAPGQEVTSIGRLGDNSWLRVEVEQEDATIITGWVSASLLSVDGDVDTLAVDNAYDPYYSPMQAFTYESGGSIGCDSVTSDGLIVQTPEGQARVTFLINEVSIDLYGSTALVEAESSGDMAITVFEGIATVSTGGTVYTAIAGSTITIAMNDDLTPAGPPTPPTPFDSSVVTSLLGIGLLTGVSTDPATEEMIALANGISSVFPQPGQPLPAPSGVPSSGGDTPPPPDDGENNGNACAPGQGGSGCGVEKDK